MGNDEKLNCDGKLFCSPGWSRKLCANISRTNQPLACPYALNCHRLPREGGGGEADVGEYGNFMGTLQQISTLVVGEMWGLGRW